MDIHSTEVKTDEDETGRNIQTNDNNDALVKLELDDELDIKEELYADE